MFVKMLSLRMFCLVYAFHTQGKPKEKPPAPEKPTCAFYLSPRGCVKEDRCEFWHPTAPNGSTSKRVCEYFNSVRGCAKDNRCDFLHIESQFLPATVAPVAAPRGHPLLQYGQMAPPQAINYSHLGQAAPTLSEVPGQRPFRPTTAQATSNAKVCTFYQGPRGCMKAITLLTLITLNHLESP
jgi:hypothetical protein